MQPELLHVLDLATLRDWRGAKAALESLDDPIASRLFSLVSELDHYESERRKADIHLRHEIGNALSIVRANLEAIVDQVLPATPERLAGMRDALADASVLLDDLRLEPARGQKAPAAAEKLDPFAIVAAQYAMIALLAESKSVSLVNLCRGSLLADVDRSTQLIRNTLVGSVRFAPPGGTVEIRTTDDTDELAVTISGFAATVTPPPTLLRDRAISGLAIGDRSLTFAVKLPNGPSAR
jgi:two-component system sensor histidine kinase BaeS